MQRAGQARSTAASEVEIKVEVRALLGRALRRARPAVLLQGGRERAHAGQQAGRGAGDGEASHVGEASLQAAPLARSGGGGAREAAAAACTCVMAR